MKPISITHPSLKGKLVIADEDCYEEDNPQIDCDCGIYFEDLQEHTVDKKVLRDMFEQLQSLILTIPKDVMMPLGRDEVISIQHWIKQLLKHKQRELEL